MHLRRRARRRLLGAIALALLAVVVLPMIFDPEPRLLGSDVDIRIPDPATPFQPSLPPAPQAPGPTPGAAGPAPTAPAPPPSTPAHATPQAATPPDGVARPVESRQPAVGKGEETVEPAKPADAAPAKPPKAPSGAFAASGYFLQLGVFSTEANARQLAEQVAAAGFKPGVHSTNGQARVRVGPFSQRADALEMQRRLKAKGFSTVLLGP